MTFQLLFSLLIAAGTFIYEGYLRGSDGPQTSPDPSSPQGTLSRRQTRLRRLFLLILLFSPCLLIYQQNQQAELKAKEEEKKHSEEHDKTLRELAAARSEATAAHANTEAIVVAVTESKNRLDILQTVAQEIRNKVIDGEPAQPPPTVAYSATPPTVSKGTVIKSFRFPEGSELAITPNQSKDVVLEVRFPGENEPYLFVTGTMYVWDQDPADASGLTYNVVADDDFRPELMWATGIGVVKDEQLHPVHFDNLLSSRFYFGSPQVKPRTIMVTK